MIDHMGSQMNQNSLLNGKGGDIFVWEEGVHDRKQEEFHGVMHLPSSFLEVSEDPDPQNLSPGALQCYCKFKKPKIETTPASSFNNQGEDEDSFLQEDSMEKSSITSTTQQHDSTKETALLEENEHQSLRHSSRITRNKYEDRSFDDQLESYEERFSGEDKEGLW